MARGRTVTLKGAAAGAFIEAMNGRKPKTEDDKHLRVATFIQMSMAGGDTDRAKLIVKHLVEHGLDKTAELFTR